MEKETRHERFKRLASKRTNEILEKIRILGNCSNKSSYEYTEDDKDSLPFFITLEPAQEKNVQKAVHKINQLPYMVRPVVIFRILK